jgi:hypothetical protein
VGHAYSVWTLSRRRMAFAAACQSTAKYSRVRASTIDRSKSNPRRRISRTRERLPQISGKHARNPCRDSIVIGLYAHFLSPGTDNVLRMAPVELRLPFQTSAVLLVLLEATGLRLGLRIFRQARHVR